MFSLAQAKRVVIKIGTGILTEGIGQLRGDRIAKIAEQVAVLREKGVEVIIVSSGAVGLGMGKLGLQEKPKQLAALQKCAAVGQSRLIETWQTCFDPHQIVVGQLLLTRDDVTSRKRHLAAKDLLEELLASGIVPIINENDSISAAELKFGDNDLLSAMVATMTKADGLIILSTAPGLVDMQGDKQIIPLVEKVTSEIENLAQGTTSVTGTGGMITKIQAARMATYSGCTVFIGSGEDPTIISDLFQGNATGTIFQSSDNPIISRKSWIAFFHKPEGSVQVDNGAEVALKTKGSSLLAKGVTQSSGQFKTGDVIAIMSADGHTFAHGIAEYDSSELKSVIGLSTEKIQKQFPDRKHCEVIHRDSLVILD